MGRERNRRDAIEMSRRSRLGGTAAGLATLLARGLPLGGRRAPVAAAG